MARKQKQYFSNPWKKSYTTKELIEILRKENKVLNQRIRTIRKATSKITGEKYESFGAVLEYEKTVEKYGRKTLPEKGLQKYTRDELKRMIQFTEELLNMQTSTVRGIRTWEKNRVKAFEEKGIHMTDKQFFDFLHSESYNRMQRVFASETLIEEVDMMRESGISMDEIYKAVDEFMNQEKDSIKDFEEILGFKRVIE